MKFLAWLTLVLLVTLSHGIYADNNPSSVICAGGDVTEPAPLDPSLAALN